MTRKEEAHAINEQLQSSYHAMFMSPGGKTVLADLVGFCHGRTSSFDPNDRVHAFNEGKRAVLMRICEFTNLTLEEIYALRGPQVRTAGGDE